MTEDRPRFDVPSDPPTSDPTPANPARLQPLQARAPDPALPGTASADEPEPVGSADDATDQEQANEEDSGGILWEITETLVLALLIFLAVRSVVLNFRVDGLSMSPNLDDGEMLLVNRQIYFHFDVNEVVNVLPFVEIDGENVIYPFHPPQRGDIIVFDPPIAAGEKPYIKRVIGLPGETVSIHDGSVYIDGERLAEAYLGTTSTSWPGRGEDFELQVPEDHLFVMGDNRNNSTDSRSFGPVAYDELIGRAWIAYWPSDIAGILQTPEYGR